MSALVSSGVYLIVGVTILTVGAVKITYAITARKLVQRYSKMAANRRTRVVAGGALVGIGSNLIAKG